MKASENEGHDTCLRAGEAAIYSITTDRYRHEAVFIHIAMLIGRLTQSVLDCIVVREYGESTGTYFPHPAEKCQASQSYLPYLRDPAAPKVLTLRSTWVPIYCRTTLRSPFGYLTHHTTPEMQRLQSSTMSYRGGISYLPERADDAKLAFASRLRAFYALL